MNKPLSRIEEIFHQMIALEPGEPRQKFIDQACGNDFDLRHELSDLMNACTLAAMFLNAPETAGHAGKATRSGPSGPPAALDASRRAASGTAANGHDPRHPPFARAVPQAATASERVETALKRVMTVLVRGRERATTTRPPRISALPVIPGYRVGSLLGAGGLGTVYEAVDETLVRTVAIKVLHEGEDPLLRARVLDEARKAASLQDPGIVTIYGVVVDGSRPAIIMERLSGLPVDEALSRVSFRERARCLREICRILARAHECGLIHRDIKPGNVIVNAALQPKLLDFGLALSREEAMFRVGAFEGSPHYASPEQASGLQMSSASDIFSFGSLMYKVLTGRVPFDGDDLGSVLQAICTTEPPFLRDVVLGVPEDLQAICLACLYWNPHRRPSAQELERELGRFLTGDPVRLRPALYGDILRRRLSEHSLELQGWRHQGVVSQEEADRLQTVHRRILADEDHWIVDARRLTIPQTVLYSSTWLVVVASLLMVWKLRDDLSGSWRCFLPVFASISLTGVGLIASGRKDQMAGAAFLAAAVLSVAPALASCMAEVGLLAHRPEGLQQLLTDGYTNHQLLAASVIAFGLSLVALRRLRMTGFAWTSCIFLIGSYFAGLLSLNWLSWEPSHQALACLPLVVCEGIALCFERCGRVRWAAPFHWTALLALVVSLDGMALEGPTLSMMGLSDRTGSYFTDNRLQHLSFAMNGFIFLSLMLIAERAGSLDLRRMGRVLEIVALPHLLTAFYLNAVQSGATTYLRLDVGLYLGTTLLLLCLGPWKSRWRLLMGGLVGLAFGSHLLLRLELVSPRPFIIGIGAIGLIVALSSYAYLIRVPRIGTGEIELADRDRDRDRDRETG